MVDSSSRIIKVLYKNEKLAYLFSEKELYHALCEVFKDV